MRLGSQRLPRKALLPLGGMTLIEHVMAALIGVPAAAYHLLTDAASAPELQPIAHRGGFELSVGPEEDVLERYAEAARRTGVATVVRATGDSPLVSGVLLRAILGEHERAGADLSHFLGCPLGTGVEVIRAAAVEQASRLASDPREREHMSTYLYRHRSSFRIHEPAVPPEIAQLNANVSVDTREDYERVSRIYRDLYRGEPIEVGDVVRWLRAHPEEVALKTISY